jgi:hypothetical protein
MSDAEDLRLLTVKQPHAWAIVAGRKDVENRTWPFRLALGTTIGIHAGVKVDPRGLRVPLDVPHDLVHGAVVGFVDVVGDHADDDCPGCSPWAAPAHRHWRLANARRLMTPVPTRGSLWLFRPPADVLSTLLAELRSEQGEDRG